jgi:lambda family phage minor tail protein L
MSIQQEVRNSWHDSIVELFELDLGAITGNSSDKYYFTGDIFPDGTKIRWKGQVYEPFPISVTGFETTTKGTIPQPELTVANVLGTLASVTNAFEDLVGGKITRRRTLGKYLDNGTSPDPSEEFPKDVYYIERKTSETSLTISWQLASKIDLEGLQIPRRIVTQNYCVWKYRGSECGYNGPPVADERDRPLSGSGSSASNNYIDALNDFNAASTAARNAEYALNLAIGQLASDCDTNTLPIKKTFSNLSGPNYSFAIVVDGQELFGVVEGNAVDIASPSRLYRPTRGIKGSNPENLEETNSIGPLSEIQQFGAGNELIATFYSLHVPISFAFPETSGNNQIGIVNGAIVPLVSSGAGYRVGARRKSSLTGIYAVGEIDITRDRCGDAGAAVAEAQAAFDTASSQLNSAQSALNAAAAALPSGDALFQQDVCGKRLNSCKIRFGATDLPFGAFPGANLSR